MKRDEFFEQYKNPKWQKKRLEILERDNFTCQSCQDSESTLNVHHWVPYRKGVKPWEYENDELITLCEICHTDITNITDFCKLLLMSRCHNIDSACEMEKIMMELDGMTPAELRNVWKILKLAKELK